MTTKQRYISPLPLGGDHPADFRWCFVFKTLSLTRSHRRILNSQPKTTIENGRLIFLIGYDALKN